MLSNFFFQKHFSTTHNFESVFVIENVSSGLATRLRLQWSFLLGVSANCFSTLYTNLAIHANFR
eukprot:06210.XXX_271463_271654_1 [CDS] Oithona nana genome sequencing.